MARSPWARLARCPQAFPAPDPPAPGGVSSPTHLRIRDAAPQDKRAPCASGATESRSLSSAAEAPGQGNGTETGLTTGAGALPGALGLPTCPHSQHWPSPQEVTGRPSLTKPGSLLSGLRCAAPATPKRNHPKRPHCCVHVQAPRSTTGLAWGLHVLTHGPPLPGWPGVSTCSQRGPGSLWGLLPSSLSSLRDDIRSQVSLSHLTQSATEATRGPGHAQVQYQPAPGTHITGDSVHTLLQRTININTPHDTF